MHAQLSVEGGLLECCLQRRVPIYIDACLSATLSSVLLNGLGPLEDAMKLKFAPFCSSSNALSDGGRDACQGWRLA